MDTAHWATCVQVCYVKQSESTAERHWWYFTRTCWNILQELAGGQGHHLWRFFWTRSVAGGGPLQTHLHRGRVAPRPQPVPKTDAVPHIEVKKGHTHYKTLAPHRRAQPITNRLAQPSSFQTRPSEWIYMWRVQRGPEAREVSGSVREIFPLPERLWYWYECKYYIYL